MQVRRPCRPSREGPGKRTETRGRPLPRHLVKYLLRLLAGLPVERGSSRYLNVRCPILESRVLDCIGSFVVMHQQLEISNASAVRDLVELHIVRCTPDYLSEENYFVFLLRERGAHVSAKMILSPVRRDGCAVKG